MDKAKVYLQEIRRMDARIDQETDELSKLKERLSGVRGVDYSRPRVQSSPKSGDAPFVDDVVRITEMEKELNGLIDERLRRISQIQQMEDNKDVSLLYKRYVEGKSMQVIADEMYYNEGYIRQLHGTALRHFEKKYLKDRNI